MLFAEIERVKKETDRLIEEDEALKAKGAATLAESMKNAIDVAKMVRKE